MTSVPMQLSRTARCVAAAGGGGGAAARRQWHRRGSDRAMLGFFLGSTLMNARRFEEERRPWSSPRPGWPPSSRRASSASGRRQARRSDTSCSVESTQRCSRSAQVEELIGWTDWDAEWAFAMALAQASMGRTEDARELLSTFGARLGSGGPSPIASTIVAGFGVLAEKEGRHGRERELFSLLTATRQGASTAAMYEVLGGLDGWDDADFANRKVAHVIGAMARETEMDRVEYFARLAALVRGGDRGRGLRQMMGATIASTTDGPGVARAASAADTRRLWWRLTR